MNKKILTFEQKDDISAIEVGTFEEQITDFINQEVDYFILNIENVSYINGEGLGVIAKCGLLAKKRNKTFIIGGVQTHIKEKFRLVRFDYFIEFFNTYQEALKAIENNTYERSYILEKN